MSACIVCGSPTGPTGEGMDWPRLVAERDRLQAENAALVAALRDLVEIVCGIDEMHRARKHFTLDDWTDIHKVSEQARAALAAHAARTEGEGPR